MVNIRHLLGQSASLPRFLKQNMAASCSTPVDGCLRQVTVAASPVRVAVG